MNEEFRDTLYSQLNERSRWYTSQRWYLSFAYITIAGLGIEKALTLHENFIRLLAFLVLLLISFATFVQILTIRFHEISTIKNMQRIEEEKYGHSVSEYSIWFISTTFYLSIIIVISSFVFVWLATSNNDFQPFRYIALSINTIWFIFILFCDRKRKRNIKNI